MAEIKQGAAPAPAAAAAAAAGQAPVKKRLPKKKLIIIVAAGLLLGAGAAGAFAYLNRKPATATEADKRAQPHKLRNFVDLEQFTVNLADKEQDRYMQIRFSLEVGST